MKKKAVKSSFEYLGVKTLAEARALPAEYLRDKCTEYGGLWVTIIDGAFQKDTYKNNLEKGKLLDVPLLMGTTNNEFIVRPSATNMEELRKSAVEMFGDDADQFLELIKVEEGLEQAVENAVINIGEYSIRFVCGKVDEHQIKGPRFYYKFDPEIPGWDNPGSFHSSDLWFWFETLAKCWRPFVGKHYDLSRQMCNYWANFIANGDPNGNDADGTPMETWEPFTPENPVCMTLYETPKAELSPTSDYMAFLLEQRLKKML